MASSSATDLSAEVYAAFRFYVKIGDDDPKAVFTEVSGLQLELEVMDYTEGGNNDFVHRLPGRAKPHPNLALKRGLVSSNDFFAWAAEVASGTIKRRNVSVVVYDLAGEEKMRWDFAGAYPVKWVGPQFNAKDSNAAVESLELAYDTLKLG